jgi:hypothetical protein
MNTEQAIARLMGEDLKVWNAHPEQGNGHGYPTGAGYGDGYSSIGHGDGIGCGYSNGKGIGFDRSFIFIYGNGYSHGI